jgi:hypothetical protein
MNNDDYKRIDDAESSIRAHFKQLRHEVLQSLNQLDSVDVGSDMAILGPFLADIEQHIIHTCIHRIRRRLPEDYLQDREESRYFTNLGRKLG